MDKKKQKMPKKEIGKSQSYRAREHPVRQKMPFSLKLIVIWMFFMVIRGIFKLFDMGEFEMSVSIMGRTIALINYLVDILVLIAFIIIICLFLFKNRNAWKYFIYLLAFIMIGVLIGFIYLPQLISLLPVESRTFVLIFTIIVSIILLLFYILLGFVVYKKRKYFVN